MEGEGDAAAEGDVTAGHDTPVRPPAERGEEDEPPPAKLADDSAPVELEVNGVVTEGSRWER